LVLQSPATFENTIRSIFPEIWLRQLAIKTCFIKRERKIKPEVMFWVLTLGFCVYNQHTIASLKRLYEMEANISISDSSWYERFTPELVEFLHKCVIHGIEELALSLIHISEPTRLRRISYAVFCLKKKKK